MNGFLVVDKPAKMTSRAVVDIAQKWFPRRTKIGHAGTLDPLATGVLVLCVGSATKLVEAVQHQEKTYHATTLLGFRSETDDADGTLTATPQSDVPTEQTIRELLPRFVGEIQQVPPQVSAIKIDGKRAYDLARKGQAVELTARMVRVTDIRLVRYSWPFVELEIDCGKGTYIRSIARDLGELLGCGGLIHQLRRTRIGSFRAEAGIPVTSTREQAHAHLLPTSIVSATR